MFVLFLIWGPKRLSLCLVCEFSVLKDGGAKGWSLLTDAPDKVVEEVAVGGRQDALEVVLLHVASWHAQRAARIR